MSAKAPEPRFQLYYWPLPFRGCFVSYLFAYCDVPLLEVTDFEEIGRLKDLPPDEQDIPFMGPPVLRDLKTDHTLSQMPAIVLYASRELGLMPQDPFELATSMKVLMDCNDVLMEICRYNGSTMWERDEWIEFRSKRLPRWLAIFEETLKRDHIGGEKATFADIGVFALFGNMTRCLPELETDLITAAPRIHAHCQRIGAQPSLASFVADQQQHYGQLYCGGFIEKSIRGMLELDKQKAGPQ